MSLTLLSCDGGDVVLPDKNLVLVSRNDGGNLIVNPPRAVWERSELTPRELTQWAMLVAAAGRAMLDKLPLLEGGCIKRAHIARCSFICWVGVPARRIHPGVGVSRQFFRGTRIARARIRGLIGSSPTNARRSCRGCTHCSRMSTPLSLPQSVRGRDARPATIRWRSALRLKRDGQNRTAAHARWKALGRQVRHGERAIPCACR